MRIDGQEALVVARTLAGVPNYDVRLSDGRLIKYAAESDLEVVEGAEVLSATPFPLNGRRPHDTGRTA